MGNETSGSTRSNACSVVGSRIRFHHAPVRASRAGDSEAIDLYLCEKDAQRAVEDCLRDEPQWRGFLHVEEVELSADFVSLN